MNPSDQELLQRYAESRSEMAFASVVQRQLPLVFAVARRQVGGDAHLAADVAQRVFADLARKARAVSGCKAISGWLVRATYFAASDEVRKARRRRAREEEAHMHQLDTQDDNVPPDPKQLQRAVDAALAGLGELERDAVMLRFFNGEGFAAIGEKFRISEDAARMRVDRALVRIRARLARAGIRTTAALLTSAIAEAGTGSVPAGLVATVTQTATASAASTGMFLSAWTMTGVIAASCAVTIGALVLERGLSVRRENLAAREAEARATLARAERELQAARVTTQAAEEDRARLRDAISSSSFSAIMNPAIDRIAFVIDTSGSMRDPKTGQVYAIVAETLATTLRTRSEARAFALLDTDGRSITDANGQVWFNNDEPRRAAAMAMLKGYRHDSLSTPVRGIERALELLDGLRDPRAHLEIVVLGDEHVGRRDATSAQLEHLNPPERAGRRRVAISGVAFPTWLVATGRTWSVKPNTHLAYERLMREVAGRHGGTFSEVTTLDTP